MRIALGIVKLFPEGGLQRDCIRLARILTSRGHDVTVFASEQSGPLKMPCETALLPVRAFTNHRTDLKFARRFAAATARGFDRVVGFNKLFGLEFYYCADPCVMDRGRTRLERSFPRHRVQTMLEGETFGPFQQTHILALTEGSAESYRRAWRTQEHRITVLDPSIDPARQQPELRAPERRAAIRAALGIAQDKRVWLLVGAQAQVKGLDRALAALKSEPNTLLLVAGVPSTSDEAIRLRRANKVDSDSVRFLGFREDIPELMAAADLLIHPARLDVTGQVILEAIVNGLPAVVTGVCGFAEHIEKSGAGIVLPEPFAQASLNAAMARMRSPALAEKMSQAGVRYGRSVAPVTGLDKAADLIEEGLATQANAPAARQATSHRRRAPISVIVATYDRPDALDAVLRALGRQSDKNFEIVVADDGSSLETTELLECWRPRLDQPLVHVRHEDRGFRLAEIRNRAIRASSGSYCIFLDGDCIPRNDFIATHRDLAEPDWFVVGNRVLMSQELTERTLRNHLEPELWEFSDFYIERRTGGINRIAPLLQLKLGPARKILRRVWTGARACNLAVWRCDLDTIDGFDASFVGWGLEDSDLLIRLLRAGVRRKEGRFATGVLHLWHPLADAGRMSSNQPLLDAVEHSNRIRAVRGLSALQDEDLSPVGSAPRAGDKMLHRLASLETPTVVAADQS